ncbi:DUF6249 domain-containing protein [Yeosuana sp. MJ-SS3]|uniref:DUF6249 domain-containing protein n=1 Tax=Gilvirhabdus luticola TaxID=3079858 RepID=A0ABU3U587_9FLAO|nr:DUF6249 domain-containing protein [Yeosuana sp. MJ-SS3]MDU8885568.1 DUF6249 domain-containing protein [Yeosuana sp. MJ-SS3]
MHSELIIVPIMFGVIFGIFYLYLSTRNKERLALIEKGADASIFMRGRSQKAAPIWKVLILNLALLLMGIGIGVFISALLVNMGIDDNVAEPGTIFLMAGIALFIGFTMTKNLDKN